MFDGKTFSIDFNLCVQRELKRERERESACKRMGGKEGRERASVNKVPNFRPLVLLVIVVQKRKCMKSRGKNCDSGSLKLGPRILFYH